MEFARLHFNSLSPAEAMVLKHAKERALLDQILPPKVRSAHTYIHAAFTAVFMLPLLGNMMPAELRLALFTPC